MGIGAANWIANSVINALIFREGTVTSQLFAPDPHEIWMRFLFWSIILLLVHARGTIAERRKTEQAMVESEERYHTLFENAHDMIQSVGTDGRFIFVNPAWLKTMGYTQDDLKTITMFDIIHPDCREHCAAAFQRVMSGEAADNVEATFISKDRHKIEVEGNVNMRFIGGKVLATQGIFHNITERKKMESQILQAKQDWEDTFNTITDMITIHDKDFNIINANKSAEKILGLPLLNVPKSKCDEYYHGDNRPPEEYPSCQCLITKQPAAFELFEPHLNIFIEIRAIPRLDEDKNLVGLIHVVRDITERKKAEEKLTALLNAVTKAKVEWEMTFNNAMEIIILIDKNFDITRCNKRFAEFVGLPVEELLGRKCYEFFTCNPEQTGHCVGKIHSGELKEWTEVKTNTGDWFYVSHCPIVDEKGEFLHSIVIAADITALKNAQRMLTESEKELKKRVEDLEKFYAMAVGRELKMKELKKETAQLNAELSKYKQHGDAG